MKRRDVVVGAAVVAASWPAFVRRAFAAPLPVGVNDVSAAFRRARAAHKPLLVFVIPVDDGAKWDRGTRLGELLNHGTDEQLAPLWLVEIVCATRAAVASLVPHLVVAGVEPLAIAVGTDAIPAVVRIVADPDLPKYAFSRDAADDEEETGRKRIALVAAALSATIVATTHHKPAAGAAADVRAKYVQQRVPGSKWANEGGCATDVEGEQPEMIGCGMGHTPALSSRFLYLFTKNKQTEEKVIYSTISGGVTINNCILHVAQHDMPFGGIGASGMGQYHGYEGFLEFSKLRPVFTNPKLSTLQFLYPPYKGRHTRIFNLLLKFAR